MTTIDDPRAAVERLATELRKYLAHARRYADDEEFYGVFDPAPLHSAMTAAAKRGLSAEAVAGVDSLFGINAGVMYVEGIERVVALVERDLGRLV